MKQPVLIGLSPNTERDDVWLALKVLAQFWRYKDARYVTELEEELSRAVQGRPVVATSSGRAALYYALQAFGIGSGDEVIVQAFTCVSVPAAVLWTGATPIYADIGTHEYTATPEAVAAAITTRTKAIIVQHTFGRVAPLHEILALARQHRVVVIEDCAHALGSRYHDQPAGTFADAAIVSFGRDKSISSVFGGAIVCGTEALAASLRQKVAKLQSPPIWWVKQQLLHPILFSLVKPWYYRGRVGQVALVAFQKLGLLSKAVTLEERSGGKPPHVQYRFSPALARLAVHQIRKLDRFTRHRHAVVQRYYAAGLRQAPLGEGIRWLRYPLRVKNRETVLAAAAAKNILLGDWYRSAVSPVTDPALVHYRPGSCPNAEQAASEIINLPTYPSLRPEHVERVIEFVRTQTHASSL